MDDIACERCGWIYMSAPDRATHMCIPKKPGRYMTDLGRELYETGLAHMKNEQKANDRQEGGSHYKTKAIQPWDYVAANDLGYFEGNVIKYVTRFKDKHGIADLRKARHYLDKLIEVEEAKIVGNG